MILRLWIDVILHEVKVTCVEIKKEVPVRTQKCSAVQSATQPAAGVGEGLLDMVERFEHIEDPWVLVEELPGEGRAAPCGGKQEDVLTRQLNRHPAFVAQKSGV